MILKDSFCVLAMLACTLFVVGLRLAVALACVRWLGTNWPITTTCCLAFLLYMFEWYSLPLPAHPHHDDQ